MKQEDKELLLKDLCSRLPYGVKCIATSNGYISYISSIESQYNVVTFDNGRQEELCDIKPYLFPLSSMTEEQMNSLTKFVANGIRGKNILYDWYNKNHFDYRGLIPKGLANDATGLNIY